MKEIKQILKILYFKKLKKSYKVKLLVGGFEVKWCFASEKQFEWLSDLFKDNGFTRSQNHLWGAFEGERFIWCLFDYNDLARWLKIKQKQPDPMYCHEVPQEIKPPTTIDILDELKDI